MCAGFLGYCAPKEKASIGSIPAILVAPFPFGRTAPPPLPPPPPLLRTSCITEATSAPSQQLPPRSNSSYTQVGGLPATWPSLTTGTIPSSTPSGPSNIPLRTLVPAARHSDEHSLLEKDEKGRRPRRSSESAGSEFSFFSDAGDLAEQLADEEDPLRIDIRGSSDSQGRAGSRRRQENGHSKRVRYVEKDKFGGRRAHRGLDKEAIQIPNPRPRKISRAEAALAVAMTGDWQSALSRGLVGKPLLYVLLVKIVEDGADRS